jgi:hypothetical protein
VLLPTRRKARLAGWELDAEVAVHAHDHERHGERVHEDAHVAEEQALPDDRRDDGDVHRVPYEAVRPADHEPRRRGDRRGRARPLDREPRERVHEDGHGEAHEHRA